MPLLFPNSSSLPHSPESSTSCHSPGRGACRGVSHTFFSLIPHCHAAFIPFLNTLSLRHHQLTDGLGCGLGRGGWNRMGAAPASPHSGHPTAPAASSWPQARHTQQMELAAPSAVTSEQRCACHTRMLAAHSTAYGDQASQA